MEVSILFGGKAGQGPNVLADILGKALVGLGYHVFCSRDYQSLIRGGHNFNVLTFSDSPIFSNESKINILVCLDENTEKTHSKNLKKGGIILNGQTKENPFGGSSKLGQTKENMYYAGCLFKILGLDFHILDNELKVLEKKYNENIKNAKEGYNFEKTKINIPKIKKIERQYTNGGQGVAEGAIRSGLDLYYAYPMTPATSVLTELAQKQTQDNFLVLELESEISVINAAIGSAITGAKSMVGTSGGGFDLMTEALSLVGMAEVPLIIYLAQRPGPSTGVPTYTGQGDLNMALKSGHGEFPRMVLAPGDPIECQEITSQSFYFSQKFKIPVIIMSDKHLAESFYTLDEKPVITKSEKSTSLTRYNSYESDASGAMTDDPKIIIKNSIDRLEKGLNIEKEAKKFSQYKIYGKKNSKNVIVSWGSTKGAILDAIKDVDCCFLQILYIDPFPKEVKKYFEKNNVMLVENNLTAQLGQVIMEKTGFLIENRNKILRFDGRPFLADELKNEIKIRIKDSNATAKNVGRKRLK